MGVDFIFTMRYCLADTNGHDIPTACAGQVGEMTLTDAGSSKFKNISERSKNHTKGTYTSSEQYFSEIGKKKKGTSLASVNSSLRHQESKKPPKTQVTGPTVATSIISKIPVKEKAKISSCTNGNRKTIAASITQVAKQRNAPMNRYDRLNARQRGAEVVGPSETAQNVMPSLCNTSAPCNTRASYKLKRPSDSATANRNRCILNQAPKLSLRPRSVQSTGCASHLTSKRSKEALEESRSHALQVITSSDIDTLENQEHYKVQKISLKHCGFPSKPSKC